MKNLMWLEGGPFRLDIDSPLLVVVASSTKTYDRAFSPGVIITSGSALQDGYYLAADPNALDEPEVGVIFREGVPEKAMQFLELTEAEEVMISGEMVAGRFLIQDLLVDGERLIREELEVMLEALNLESLDDQYLGYN